jgi:hypothetical protein
MVTATIDVDICVHTSADEESTYNHRAFHTLPSCSFRSPEPESTTNEEERASEKDSQETVAVAVAVAPSCDVMRFRPASSVPANAKEVTHRPTFRQRRQIKRGVAVAQYHQAGGSLDSVA